MPIWVTLYLGLMLISLPMGLAMLRRMERDWLHPVGGLISTLLSMGFVLAYWLPDNFSFHYPSVFVLYGFVLFWDIYMLNRLQSKLPDLLESLDEPMPQPKGIWWIGIVLMLPAYYFGLMVCLNATAQVG